jgi:uncharacterized protein (TIGR02118 family)
MKTVSILARKSQITPLQFYDYYEEKHAPLAVKFFPFTRYVRNHLEEGSDVGFDTISEFWADEFAEIVEIRKGPAGDIMDADVARFMVPHLARGSSVDEIILSRGAQTDLAGLRYAVLLRWESGNAIALVREWASLLAAKQPGVSLDVMGVLGEGSFPADAILWVPDYFAGPPAPGALDLNVLRVRRCETPISDLLPYKVSVKGG